MSTTVELPATQLTGEPILNDLVKNVDTKTPLVNQQTPQLNQDKNQHPLHQYDWTKMSKFYESCVGKLKEQNPKWQPSEWGTKIQPTNTVHPETVNPLLFSQKQRVYEAFATLSRETGEPMVLMPNFDYGDIINFEHFLQALKQDGINAIEKYRQYLSYKDMRKFEVDLVVIHPRYGVMLFEIKDCDHLDTKRRNRARFQLSNARSCFESMGRLIMEAKGWTTSEAYIPITEFIALPNVPERPVNHTHQNGTLHTPGGNQNTSASSVTSTGRNSRVLNYLIKGDLENTTEFSKWWTKCVVEPKQAQLLAAEAENKTNKFDTSVINWILGLINCIRNNSIMPVVYPETGTNFNGETITGLPTTEEPQPTPKLESTDATATTEDGQLLDKEKEKTPVPKEIQFQQALNVHGEFFPLEHESVRAVSKVVITSKDAEKIRKTICLQTLWLLLNDSQKKISVVCSELNKIYYEEFFAHQRKLYNTLHNVRFYTDLHSCAVNGQHTIKKDGETWFFDSGINGTMNDVIERVKELNAFWIFTTQDEMIDQFKTDLETLNVKCVKLDQTKPLVEEKDVSMPWLNGTSFKFPLRLHCDLLIIGDIVSPNQMKTLFRYLKSSSVINQPQHYQNNGHHQNQYHNNHQPQQQKLNFNPAKKFRSVKFIRGGTIDNLRTSLKMHDSIQAPVVLMHVGDEDLFKTRNSVTTIERIKELSNLVKEYCPKSFVMLSTLMRRMSRTENTVTNEVNKGIINYCKQTRDTSNIFFMLNSHFEPDFHTQEGRILSNKGLRLYVDNILFVVDFFLIRNNKQH